MLCSFVLWPCSCTHYSCPLLVTPQLFPYFHLYLLKETHLPIMIRGLTFNTNSTIVAEGITRQKRSLRLYDIASVLCIMMSKGRCVMDHVIKFVLHFLSCQFLFFRVCFIFQQPPHSDRLTLVLREFYILIFKVINFVHNGDLVYSWYFFTTISHHYLL